MDKKKQLVADFITALAKNDDLFGVVIVGDTKDGKSFSSTCGTARQIGTLFGQGISQFEDYFEQSGQKEGIEFAHSLLLRMAQDFLGGRFKVEKNYTIEPFNTNESRD